MNHVDKSVEHVLRLKAAEVTPFMLKDGDAWVLRPLRLSRMFFVLIGHIEFDQSRLTHNGTAHGIVIPSKVVYRTEPCVHARHIQSPGDGQGNGRGYH